MPVGKRDGGIGPRNLGVIPSPELEVITGRYQLSGGQALKLVFDYITSHGLLNPNNPREILADAVLEKISGKKVIRLVEVSALVKSHLTRA